MLKEVCGNTAVFVCPECNSEFEAEYNLPENDFADAIRCFYDRLTCQACSDAREARTKEEFSANRKQYLIETLEDRLAKTGLPEKFRSLITPPCRPGAEWIYRNRRNSLLISGETGTGKTSSAGFVMKILLQEQPYRILYRNFQNICAEFIQSKVSSLDSEIEFFRRIDSLDYLVIDEIIGKRGDGKMTPSQQDLFFSIIDGVYSQSRKTRVWLLGNFYDGSIEDALNDPDPVRRRLQESFKAAWFNKHDPVDTGLVLFNEK